ncbi:MAG: DUF4040 domain-containing protein [Phycisphaeraceae bacterium]|nr:MAG: DUF4040 domain-containing protein [Phycisphaeraceae bacterium]
MTALLFDVLLALMLTVLAWRVVTTRELLQSVVLFIAYGLLMAIAWTRLDAPDIALAEAAIGAGLMGVLLLDTAGELRRRHGWRSEGGDDDTA